jgi:hypothetical protein
MLRARIWLGGAIVTLGLGLSAGSAQAAIAYTSEATAGGTSATAYGYVSTQGETTVWSFIYGTSTKYGSSSKAVAIRNSNSAVMVSGYLGNLKSATTYHYRLFAVPYDSSGNPDWAHASIGRDATFRTTRGRANLLSTRLAVTRGAVSIPLQCASTLTCSGSVSLDTRTHAHCASQRFSLAGGARSTFSPRLTSSCARLVSGARGHRLAVIATGRLSTGQAAPNQTVTLSG